MKLINKWYLAIAVVSLIVLYDVAKGLERLGFIKFMDREIKEILYSTASAARNCIPKIDFRGKELLVKDFFECLGNPDAHETDAKRKSEVDKIINEQGNLLDPDIRGIESPKRKTLNSK